MSIELLSTIAGAGWILALALMGFTIARSYKDTLVCGTWVIPLFQWCSIRHVYKAAVVSYGVGVQTLALVWAVLAEEPSQGLIDTFGLLSAITSGVILLVYVAIILIGRRAEAKWAPALVTAVSNSYCTGCGHPVKVGKAMGGYCPVCGADPDKECNAHRHGRFDETGDPNPLKAKKAKSGAAKRRGRRA